jgi:hypothetical protein
VYHAAVPPDFAFFANMSLIGVSFITLMTAAESVVPAAFTAFG